MKPQIKHRGHPAKYRRGPKLKKIYKLNIHPETRTVTSQIGTLGFSVPMLSLFYSFYCTTEELSKNIYVSRKCYEISK
jgi:hypothetical protein